MSRTEQHFDRRLGKPAPLTEFTQGKPRETDEVGLLTMELAADMSGSRLVTRENPDRVGQYTVTPYTKSGAGLDFWYAQTLLEGFAIDILTADKERQARHVSPENKGEQ